jgi:hypothetical protein
MGEKMTSPRDRHTFLAGCNDAVWRPEGSFAVEHEIVVRE